MTDTTAMQSPTTRRRGLATPLVVVFLACIGVVALMVSSQSSSLRRMGSQVHRGFEVLEICDSAVNEASSAVEATHVFEPRTFPDLAAFFRMVANDDPASQAQLKGGFAGCTFHFRPVRDAKSRKQIGEIFASMTWAKTAEVKLATPETARVAALMPGFSGPLVPVRVRPLSWRRDWVGANWQNWGVLRFEATATILQGKVPITRTLFVDRLFTLPVDVDPTDADGMNPTVGFVKSTRNLKTVIRRG